MLQYSMILLSFLINNIVNGDVKLILLETRYWKITLKKKFCKKHIFEALGQTFFFSFLIGDENKVTF